MVCSYSLRNNFPDPFRATHQTPKRVHPSYRRSTHFPGNSDNMNVAVVTRCRGIERKPFSYIVGLCHRADRRKSSVMLADELQSSNGLRQSVCPSAFEQDSFTSQDQSLISVDGTLCPQLCHDEREHVLRLPLHQLANVLEVRPQSLRETRREKGGGMRGNRLGLF